MNKETSRRSFLAAALFGSVGCVAVLKGRPVAGDTFAERLAELKNMKPSDFIIMGGGDSSDAKRRRNLKEIEKNEENDK